MRHSRFARSLLRIGAAAAILVSMQSCSEQDSLPLIVQVPGLTISKLPFVIAMDQGLYAKHGLAVELRVPTPESDGKVVSVGNFWGRALAKIGLGEDRDVDINVAGGIPMMMHVAERGPRQRQIMLGATDCVFRAHIIGRKGLTRIEDLKGGRIGVSTIGATSGYQALVLAQRMGWDPEKDISILMGYEHIDSLLDGSLDALVAYEAEIAPAAKEGLPTLADLSSWNEPISGNSILVGRRWLEDPAHREAARRFLRATAEAIALFHQQPQIAREIIAKWYGVTDPEAVRIIYEQGASIPRVPYPCYDGIEKGMQVRDSNEMRRYKPTDFYDDSLLREIDASGFIAALYKDAPAPAALLETMQ